MPLVILSQTAEASAARASKQTNDRFYDCETLRDFCGCLIHVNTKTEDVTFAHYTVQEYLNRTHIFQGISEKLNRSFFLNFMYTETLRIHQEDPNNHEHHFQHEDLAINAQLNGSFYIYCALSSFISLDRGADEIEQKHVSIIADLLDPSKSHINRLRRTLNMVSGRFYSSPNHAKTFYIVEWGTDVNTYNLGVMHLLNIVFAVSDATKILVLAEHVLRIKSFGSFDFEAELTLIIPYGESYSDGYKFRGTIMDLLAQLGDFGSGEPMSLVLFNYLLEQNLVKGCDIALYIAAHNHFVGCQDFCALEHLLSTGGDPNQSGYRVTPLQIAVFLVDPHGVDILLKAGADPNGTGDHNGRVWEENEVLSSFNFLEGISPLRISKNRQELKYASPRSQDLNITNISRIENALLQHGARDFNDELEEVSEVASEEDYKDGL